MSVAARVRLAGLTPQGRAYRGVERAPIAVIGTAVLVLPFLAYTLCRAPAAHELENAFLIISARCLDVLGALAIPGLRVDRARVDAAVVLV